MLSTKNKIDSDSIFLIGNNPIELSNIYDKLKGIRTKTYQTEIVFELAGLFRKIRQFDPACIFIDDNVERSYLKKLMTRLSRNRYTREIPIAILKNDNKDTSIDNADDYLLKADITTESLSRSIINSMRARKMKLKLAKVYKSKKSMVKSWFN